MEKILERYMKEVRTFLARRESGQYAGGDTPEQVLEKLERYNFDEHIRDMISASKPLTDRWIF